MHYNFKYRQHRLNYYLNLFNLSIQRLFFNFSLFIHENLRTLRRSLRSAFQCLFRGSKLSRQIFLVFMVVTFHPFPGHALTSKTSNVVHGSVPYLTFDGGRTRATNTDGLLGITLSNGTKYTPSTNNSANVPIELPVLGQSFADIGMLVPTDTNSVALSTIIDLPYNYWGDDDGDGDITAVGNLSLSIVDKNNRAVSRNTVLSICDAPYKVRLVSTDGTLSSRYGVPKISNFSASNVTYYIKPKVTTVVCFAKPNLHFGKFNEIDEHPHDFRGPQWDENRGFLTQSRTPPSYDLNFPTTGAHGLYFDLEIAGNEQVLSWAPVSRGGITATMTNSSSTSVRVTLTGPVATSSQHSSNDPGYIYKPTLPQTFELIGRDSHGNEIAKYGFVLKQWFVNRGKGLNTYYDAVAWCNSTGYQMPKVRDLTNATCHGSFADECQGSVSATPSSPNNFYQRRIGAGLFAEWGSMYQYNGANFDYYLVWTSEQSEDKYQFVVSSDYGSIERIYIFFNSGNAICVSAP